MLQNYEIVDPNPPAHLEWKRITSESVKPAYSQAFLNSLKKLFSLEKTLEIPFVLNLSESKLEFEGKISASQSSLFRIFLFHRIGF